MTKRSTTGSVLMDQDEGRAAIREYIESRDWWIIPGVAEAAGDLMDVIERRYYSGAAAADFHLVLATGSAVFAVAFAHKRRMGASSLAALLEEQDGMMIAGGSEEALAAGKDILVSYYEDEQEDAIGRAFAWNAELTDRAAS